MLILGIDPGWASCGISLKSDSGLEYCSHFIPRDVSQRSLIEPVQSIVDHIQQNWDAEFKETSLSRVYMERYVAYKGIHSDMSEAILMFIGASRAYFELNLATVEMVRAIDWKPKVCKYLVRTQGFKNPSTSFDKKFSIAAANALSGKHFDNDHMADAVCLSYLADIDRWNEENGK